MSTDTEILQKFLEEYNNLKRENTLLHDQITDQQAQLTEFFNEIQRLKKENQKLAESSHFLNDQLTQFKQLYSETRTELQESFNFIRSMNRKSNDTQRMQKTGTFEDEDNNKHISQLLEIFAVDNVDQLIATAEKIRQVMMGVQAMEQFCRQICEIVLDDVEFQNFDCIVAVIQKWKVDQKYLDCFINFKQNIENVLGLQNSTDQQILECIRNRKPTDPDIETVKVLFKINQDENFMFRMNQMFILLQDIQQFIKIAKRLLDLEDNMKNEACMVYILKLLEKFKLSDQELGPRIMKILKLEHASQIIPRIEQLILI